MKRVIIKIQPYHRAPDSFYLDEPSHYFTDDSMLYPFSPRVSPAITNLKAGKLKPNTVSAAGQWLLKQLSSHPAVAGAISHLLKLSSTGEYPIYIQTQSTRSQELPWETLCYPPANFLSLDRRWPIGRITTSDEERTATEYVFNVPIKMTAVLSALNVPAKVEWEALYAAIKASTLPIKLLVLVSEDALFSHISNLGDPNVQVVSIPIDANRLQRVIAESRPSILHFFCHGSDSSGPMLHVARREDWATRSGLGSIAFNTATLANTNPRLNKTAWLVTLNCCNSGAVVKNGEVFAQSLVGRGFPVVIGMREAVVSTDAHLFCHALYEECFERIKLALASQSGTFEICWPALLSSARERLGMKYSIGISMPAAAVELKQWTLPVLYTRKQDVKLRPEFNQTAQIISQLATTQEIGEVLTTIPGTPESVIDRIINQTEQKQAKPMNATAGA